MKATDGLLREIKHLIESTENGSTVLDRLIPPDRIHPDHPTSARSTPDYLRAASEPAPSQPASPNTTIQ